MAKTKGSERGVSWLQVTKKARLLFSGAFFDIVARVIPFVAV